MKPCSFYYSFIQVHLLSTMIRFCRYRTSPLPLPFLPHCILLYSLSPEWSLQWFLGAPKCGRIAPFSLSVSPSTLPKSHSTLHMPSTGFSHGCGCPTCGLWALCQTFPSLMRPSVSGSQLHETLGPRDGRMCRQCCNCGEQFEMGKGESCRGITYNNSPSMEGCDLSHILH